MTAVRFIRDSVLSVLAAAMLLALLAASSSAQSAWWRMSSGSVPAILQPGKAKNEVEELTVNATGGSVQLSTEPAGEHVVFLVKSTSFPYDASAEEVQSRIETELYPERKVRVTGGPDATGSSYTITFPGELVNPLDAGSSLLTGGEHRATITTLSKGRPDGRVFAIAANLGDVSVEGGRTPVRLADVLPPNLEAVEIEGIAEDRGNLAYTRGAVTCSIESLVCTFAGKLTPYDQIEVLVGAVVKGGASSGEVNEASVSGGELPGASIRRGVRVGDEATPFGVETYEMTPETETGAPDTQAGSHPFQLTTMLALNQIAETGFRVEAEPAALPKDLNFKLPPGLIGNPKPFPQCPLGQFLATEAPCPEQTAVGVASVYIYEPGILQEPLTRVVPVFNLEPEAGEPARFGFAPIIPQEGELPARVILDTSVRTNGDYGVTVSVDNITQLVGFISSRVTLWGVPGDPRHNNMRGWGCLVDTATAETEFRHNLPCGSPATSNPPPLLSLPTSCTGPLQTSVEAESWAQVGSFLSFPGAPMPALDGCNRLPFSPSITVAPDAQDGSTPTGLGVDVHVPQDVSLNGTGLGEADVKDTTVALPVGVQISPAAADGLLACSLQQVGFTGVEEATGANLFSLEPIGCPEASKIGTAVITSPLLVEPLEGGVYLAAQNANPFGSLIAMYIHVEAPKEGIDVKIAGEVRLNEATGQIVASFPNTPQLPFEDAKLHFFGSDRAPLSTPPLCGLYTTAASIAPWSGNPPADASSTFEITHGPNGAPCASPRPFTPGFEAGTTNVQAGGYTPLTITMSRPDADQALGKLSVVFPPGVSAGLEGVKLCEEPQAASGDCPTESQIGQVVASAGLGGDPYSVETGKAYITGSYEGAPFGVDVVVPAVAGPFNLGTEVVRSKVEVDPTDAHLTVVSDPFPTILDGIPLQLQHINVTVDRPGFVFNPTSCEPMKLTGELESVEGATADVSTPFQVTNCAALSFKPEFKVSTEAKTSRTEGATLHVRLTLPSGAQGTKANVKEVKVSLPKQLPSPLKTLQKACTEKVFAENPSNCPVASRVGEAHVTTPVLEGGLKGPAYFVSHGGAKYPELIMVLVGEDGVTVQVHGETFISKQGITTATFSTVPDVPFSTFELELPKREYPALSANGNLCQAQAAGKLLMPTEMVGQNGDKITQSTKISVTGCPKSKKVAHKKKHRTKKAKRGSKKG